MTHDDDTCPHLVRANLLEAENARLKAEVERLQSIHSIDSIGIEQLKAEVERLTYVGDAMAMMVGHIEVKGDAHRMMLEFSNEWNAAKEGKQS